MVSYLTPAEYGRIFKFSPQTVRKLCEKGRIPGAVPVECGKKTYWRIPNTLPEISPARKGDVPPLHASIQEKIDFLKGKSRDTGS